MQRSPLKLTSTLLMATLTLAVAGPASATPPPWAPAHGYRDKHHDRYEHREHYSYREYRPALPWHSRDQENRYIRNGRCDRDALGAVVGGVVGGLAGSRLGKGDGRTVATIAGTVIGILVGRSIGQSMNASDQQCTGQVLEHVPDRAAIQWRNPDTGAEYQVTPTTTYQDPGGRYCREYTTRATIGGRAEQVYGRACRQPDGSWARL
ncbi:MAG: RT0821/Lpp0805 family surface protein [Pseudomonadota bacterium]